MTVVPLPRCLSGLPSPFRDESTLLLAHEPSFRPAFGWKDRCTAHWVEERDDTYLDSTFLREIEHLQGLAGVVVSQSVAPTLQV